MPIFFFRMNVLGFKQIEYYLHFFFFILLLLVRWIRTQGHLQAVLRAVKHNFIRKHHCLLDNRFATKKHASCFRVTAVGTWTTKQTAAAIPWSLIKSYSYSAMKFHENQPWYSRMYLVLTHPLVGGSSKKCTCTRWFRPLPLICCPLRGWGTTMQGHHGCPSSLAHTRDPALNGKAGLMMEKNPFKPRLLTFFFFFFYFTRLSSGNFKDLINCSTQNQTTNNWKFWK